MGNTVVEDTEYYRTKVKDFFSLDLDIFFSIDQSRCLDFFVGFVEIYLYKTFFSIDQYRGLDFLWILL